MKSMHWKIPSILSHISIVLICLLAVESEATCFNPFSRSGTKSPINIISSKVTKGNLTTKPLTLANAIFDFVNLTNTGKTLDAYSNQLLDPSIITGGPLCDKIYKIHTIRFYINQNVNGRSAHTIDGKGTPLEMTVIYYKIVYGSLENALKFPDGITVLGFPVKIGPIPNVAFVPLQASLAFDIVKKPHSSFPVPGLIVYIWFDNIVITLSYKYYFYLGSYYDPETGRLAAQANYLLIDPEQALTLTEAQFKAFKHVLDLKGKPLNSAPPIYPQGSTQVKQYIGIEQVLLPVV